MYPTSLLRTAFSLPQDSEKVFKQQNSCSPRNISNPISAALSKVQNSTFISSPSTFKNKKKLAAKTSEHLQLIKHSAEQFSGKCHWLFTQSDQQITQVYSLSPQPIRGICEVLSALWIIKKTQGECLKNYLYNHANQLDLNTIRYILQVHITSITLNPYAITETASDETHRPGQVAAIKKWLTAKGLRNISIETWSNEASHTNPQKHFEILNYLKTTAVEAVEKQDETFLDLANNMAATIIENKIPSSISDGSYRMILLLSPKLGGHRMAAWVGNKDITFFDPNCGEFYFEDKNTFAAWWPIFLQNAQYDSYLSNQHDIYCIDTYLPNNLIN